MGGETGVSSALGEEKEIYRKNKEKVISNIENRGKKKPRRGFKKKKGHGRTTYGGAAWKRKPPPGKKTKKRGKSES